MATIGGATAANMNPNKSIESYEKQMVRRNGDDWPKDVVIDILSRLPVKSLLRFKCLNKSWCIVIQSPEFVSKHLNNYHNNSSNSSVIAQCYLNNSDSKGDLLMISPNQTSQYRRFDLPFYASILGPCNGIFLLYEYSSTQYSLWNPATKQLITLPPSPNPELPSHMELGIPRCGFGLNPATNDFKIVAIRRVCEEDDFHYYPSRVMVYTSSSNSWRDLGNPLQDDQWHYRETYCYTYVHGQGIYYWLVSTDDNHILVSFDMGSDSFEFFQMPVWWDRNSCNIIKAITIYHDSLAFLSCQKDKGCIDMWVMNNRNWIKQLSVLSPVGLVSLFGIWTNDWFVIRTADKPLVIWNAVTGEVKQLSLHSSVDDNYIKYCMGFLTCEESLFSIKIGGDDR